MLVLLVLTMQAWESEVVLLLLLQVHEVGIHVLIVFKSHKLAILVPPDSNWLNWLMWLEVISSASLLTVVLVQSAVDVALRAGGARRGGA